VILSKPHYFSPLNWARLAGDYFFTLQADFTIGSLHGKEPENTAADQLPALD